LIQPATICCQSDNPSSNPSNNPSYNPSYNQKIQATTNQAIYKATNQAIYQATNQSINQPKQQRIQNPSSNPSTVSNNVGNHTSMTGMLTRKEEQCNKNNIPLIFLSQQQSNEAIRKRKKCI
jgi:hypothetical protein